MDDDARTTTPAQRIWLAVLAVLGIAAVAWAALVGGPAASERVEARNAIAGHWGDPASSDQMEAIGRHWLVLDPDGTVHGHDGCNYWSTQPGDGSWTLGPDGVATWPGAVKTSMACDGMIAVPAAARLDGDELVLLTWNREEIARFTRTSALV